MPWRPQHTLFGELTDRHKLLHHNSRLTVDHEIGLWHYYGRKIIAESINVPDRYDSVADIFRFYRHNNAFDAKSTGLLNIDRLQYSRKMLVPYANKTVLLSVSSIAIILLQSVLIYFYSSTYIHLINNDSNLIRLYKDNVK